MVGVKQDRHVRGVCKNLAGRAQPVHLRHCQVENDDIGGKLGGFLSGLAAVCAFSTTLPVRVSLEQRLQHLPYQLLVVCDENPIRQKASQNNQRCSTILNPTLGTGGFEI